MKQTIVRRSHRMVGITWLTRVLGASGSRIRRLLRQLGLGVGRGRRYGWRLGSPEFRHVLAELSGRL